MQRELGRKRREGEGGDDTQPGKRAATRRGLTVETGTETDGEAARRQLAAASGGGGGQATTQPSSDERRGDEAIAPGAELGRYSILRRVGHGGMGVVYEARDRELGRAVAIKVLRRAGGAGNAARRARLVREAQTMAKLAHANLVPVFDVGELAGDLFVAMELVEGEDLARWLRREARPWQEVVRVFLQAARGLQAAHAAGVIHRDFKPSNVMMGKDGRARVLDFGLARMRGAREERGQQERDARALAAGSRDEESAARGAESGSGSGSGSGSESASESGSGSGSGSESGSGSGSESGSGSGSGSGPGPGSESGSGSGSESESVLTEIGALLGTPAYMAPSQLRGETADALCDQYAFAVSLREALTGAVPYSGPQLAAQIKGEAELAVPPWPPACRAPRGLRRLVDRAMAPDAAARFRSMAQLISALEAILLASRRRRFALAAAAALLTVAIAASGLARMTASAAARPACDGGAELLAGAWDASIASGVAARFAASGAPGAAQAAQAVRAQLDGYATRWTSKRREVCRATFDRGEQSERVMGLRFACLERRRAELAALTGLFGDADRAVVHRSLAAVNELPTLEACDDVVALDSLAPPPRDAEARRQLAEVQLEVDRAVAQRRAGQYREGLAAAAAFLPRAEALGHAPLTAAALSATADLENWGGDAARAAALYRRAARLYAEVGDDAGLASSWMTLVFVVGVLEGKVTEGEQLGEFASTLVARRRDKVMTAQLENHLGGVAFGANKLEESAAHFEKALALRREVLGAEHLAVASTLANLGAVRRQQDRLDEAERVGMQALQIRERALGAEHPEVAISLRNLSALAISRQQLERARELETRALEIYRRASGEEHFEVASSLNNLGQSYMEEKKYAEAVRYQERALAIYRKSLPAAHPLIGKAAFSLAEGLAELRRYRESLALAEESLRILDTPDGNPVDRAHAAFQVALALGALGRERPRARKLMTEARDQYREIGAEKWQGMADRWLEAQR